MADAAAQSWPPFVLVVGLLTVGAVAYADGLFSVAGRRLESLPGGTGALFACSALLVAVVTAVLNLDTAVVFLTPVLVLAARHRGVDETPFLYAAVFMANASSLFLPGSNLTNLLVLEEDPISGGEFARTLAAPALVAAVVTGVGLWLLHRRALSRPATAPVRPLALVPKGRSVGLSVAAVGAVALAVVLLREPALPVLAIGVVTVAVRKAQGRVDVSRLLRSLGLPTLLGLFAASVALGTLARAWDAPGSLVESAGRWKTAIVGFVASVLVNNLPAAVLLSAQEVAHPRALLVGLNLGPNLAVTGSLSALLWFRAARQVGASPSIAGFSRRGLVLAPLALVCALGVAALLGTPA